MLTALTRQLSAGLAWLGVGGREGLVFCSLGFLAFFAAVFALYWALPWRRARVWLLVAASFAFYATWSKELAFIVLLSASLDFFLARGVEALRSPRLRRLLVAASVVANLGLLCWFKYADFFVGSLRDALRLFGAETFFPTLKVLAPIGISFYTFEAISYVVDVYRGKARAERSLPNFLLFILFFPHLISGPIVRARDFLPQVGRRKRWDPARIHLGVRFFLLGLLKKWAVADRMALYVDPVFADPAAYRSHVLWLAVLAYALQVYCDFSGYTDMAIGAAHLLGYRLAQNFNLPYLSANIAEFWRRWHISLSSWLRDYLYIPLGGSRQGRGRTYLNLLIVMTLGGLWHGASWPFVVFGVIQGAFLAVHRAFAAFCRPRPWWQRLLGSGPGTAGRVLFTFLCFALSLVVFRAQDFARAGTFFARLVLRGGERCGPQDVYAVAGTAAVVLACHLAARRDLWRRLADRLPAPVLGAVYALLLTLCLVLAPPTGKPFIYFQF
jgi:alginate O-acetyltransferase complex protein AlgI